MGACGCGKSTLVASLQARGYAARAVAQEHSVIPELWRHAGRPGALILLEAQRSTIIQRRGADFPGWLLDLQYQRLASARKHADLSIVTDGKSAEEVVSLVLEHVRSAGIAQHPPSSEGALHQYPTTAVAGPPQLNKEEA